MSIESTENKAEKLDLLNPLNPKAAQMIDTAEDESEGESGRGTSGSALKKKDTSGRKRKLKEHVECIVVHIRATFNNTKITVTKLDGDTLSFSSAGERKFRGSRKRTPFAAQVATMHALQKAADAHGMSKAIVYVNGPGPGRDAAIRAVKDFATVLEIRDVTPTPHNGVRPPKERRV